MRASRAKKRNMYPQHGRATIEETRAESRCIPSKENHGNVRSLKAQIQRCRGLSSWFNTRAYSEYEQGVVDVACNDFTQPSSCFDRVPSRSPPFLSIRLHKVRPREFANSFVRKKLQSSSEMRTSHFAPQAWVQTAFFVCRVYAPAPTRGRAHALSCPTKRYSPGDHHRISPSAAAPEVVRGLDPQRAGPGSLHAAAGACPV